ncbi:serine hydrolase domain-containing protein [Acidobacteriota bacterium]
MNKKMISIVILAAGILLLSCCKGGNSQDPAADIDAFAKEWMKAGKIPGMSVGVIKNNKVIFLKGYGYADKKTLRPVTPQTTFFIASGAKSFTAMVMGLLVNEGKLEWDRSIRDYLPGFKMVDGFATQYLSTRDLLCHRIALPKKDHVWKQYIGTQRTRRDFMKEFGNIKPIFSFRENFRYQNLGYILAAHTAETLTGLTYEEIVRERIFKPLGMNNSLFNIVEMKDKSDFAFPYRREGGNNFKEIPFPETGIARPANGIYTNAEDLIQWLRLHLTRGRIKGKQFIPEKTIKEMHTIQVTYRQYPYSPNWITMGYGLGWIIDIYRGHYLLQHGGGVPGFTSMMAFLPFENVGVVVLCNTGDTEVPGYLMRNIVDILLNVEPLNLKI